MEKVRDPGALCHDWGEWAKGKRGRGAASRRAATPCSPDGKRVALSRYNLDKALMDEKLLLDTRACGHRAPRGRAQARHRPRRGRRAGSTAEDGRSPSSGPSLPALHRSTTAGRPHRARIAPLSVRRTSPERARPADRTQRRTSCIHGGRVYRRARRVQKP